MIIVTLYLLIDNQRTKRQAYDPQWINTLSGESYRRKQGPAGRKSLLEEHNNNLNFERKFHAAIALHLDVLTIYFQEFHASAYSLQCLSHRECY